MSYQFFGKHREYLQAVSCPSTGEYICNSQTSADIDTEEA